MITVRAPAIWKARRRPNTPSPAPDLAEAGVAGRQHRPLGALEVEGGDFLGGQDAVLLIRLRGLAPVRAGEGQAGQQQRILDRGRRPPARRHQAADGACRREAVAGAGFAEEEAMRGEVDDAVAGQRALDDVSFASAPVSTFTATPSDCDQSRDTSAASRPVPGKSPNRIVP